MTDKRSFQRFVRKLDKIGLRTPIEKRTLVMHHVSLQDLYGGRAGRGSSIVAARRDVYTWLIERGKSVNEIARLFDRAPSGVFKMVRKGAERMNAKK